MPDHVLSGPIKICGGQTGLARELMRLTGREVTQQRIWAIVHRRQPVPAEWCIPIEIATGSKITRHDLRPDLYPREEAPR